MRRVRSIAFQQQLWREVYYGEFHQKVEELPKEQREVFDLLYYHGVTQPEAAQVLGMSERTLKRRWQETRQAMYKAVHGIE